MALKWHIYMPELTTEFVMFLIYCIYFKIEVNNVTVKIAIAFIEILAWSGQIYVDLQCRFTVLFDLHIQIRDSCHKVVNRLILQ